MWSSWTQFSKSNWFGQKLYYLFHASVDSVQGHVVETVWRVTGGSYLYPLQDYVLCVTCDASVDSVQDHMMVFCVTGDASVHSLQDLMPPWWSRVFYASVDSVEDQMMVICVTGDASVHSVQELLPPWWSHEFYASVDLVQDKMMVICVTNDHSVMCHFSSSLYS